jgi:hypothetical protein
MAPYGPGGGFFIHATAGQILKPGYYGPCKIHSSIVNNCQYETGSETWKKIS